MRGNTILVAVPLAPLYLAPYSQTGAEFELTNFNTTFM